MSRLLHTSITVFSGRLISDKQIMLPLLSPHLQSRSNTGALIMLSDLSAAAQSCCGKWEACRPPRQIIEGSQWWQRCFLIEDLMLLCIQEADVGLSTIGKDSRARARIWIYWSVRKGEWQDGAFRCFCGIGHQGHMSQAGLQLRQGVYLICKRRFIDFLSGSEDSDCTKCRAKCLPKWIWFSKMRKWALDFKWREFYFLLKGGLEEEIEASVQRGGRADIISLTNSLCYSSFQGLIS